MKTITKKIKVYEFEELPEDIQERIINNHRYTNVSDEWWDGVVDSHISDWKEKYGINAKSLKVCFSLDRNQYLYFPGNYIWVEDVKKFVKAIESVVPTKVVKAIRDGDVIVSLDVRYYGGGDGKQIASYEVYNTLDLPETGKEITDWMNESLLRPLWKELNDSYYLETSDEAIKGALCDNEYTFDEEGNII